PGHKGCSRLQRRAPVRPIFSPKPTHGRTFASRSRHFVDLGAESRPLRGVPAHVEVDLTTADTRIEVAEMARITRTNTPMCWFGRGVATVCNSFGMWSRSHRTAA